MQFFHQKSPFRLESGATLQELTLAYTTSGIIRSDGSNVVWICHALTGNAEAEVWWSGLIGPGKIIDTNQFFVICVNAIGSCYGSTGPLSINPLSGKKYYHTFPEVTNRDIVRSFELLRNHLGIKKIYCLMGGSLGGQQVLEWAIQCPDLFDHIIPIACNAWHSSWGVAFNESQRMAIETDRSWLSDDDYAGLHGLETARAIAMLSYRTYSIYEKNQPIASDTRLSNYPSSSYQRYMGKKLSGRFNAFSYHRLTSAMDSHHIGRGRGSAHDALTKIKARALVIGIDQDILFPISEQKFLTRFIPGAVFGVLNTGYGHDGFLVEFGQLEVLIRNFFSQSLK